MKLEQMLIMVLHMHSTLHTCNTVKLRTNQYLKSAVLMPLNGGMVHDVFSCLCLHHASHTVMQYSVSCSVVVTESTLGLMAVGPVAVHTNYKHLVQAGHLHESLPGPSLCPPVLCVPSVTLGSLPPLSYLRSVPLFTVPPVPGLPGHTISLPFANSRYQSVNDLLQLAAVLTSSTDYGWARYCTVVISSSTTLLSERDEGGI